MPTALVRTAQPGRSQLAAQRQEDFARPPARGRHALPPFLATPTWSPPPTAPKRASQLGSLHTWRVPNAQRLSSFEVSNPKGPGMPWLYTSALFHESSDGFFNALMILWICVEVSHLLQTQARPSRAQVRLPLRSSFHLHRFHRIRTLSHMAQFQHQTGYAVAGGPLQRAHR